MKSTQGDGSVGFLAWLVGVGKPGDNVENLEPARLWIPPSSLCLEERGLFMKTDVAPSGDGEGAQCDPGPVLGRGCLYPCVRPFEHAFFPMLLTDILVWQQG